jgi:type IV secretion system protein VirB5
MGKEIARIAALMVVGIATGLFWSPAVAQIPVTITSDVPGQIWHVEKIAKYVEQIEKAQAQLQQLEKTYKAITGVRNMGDLFRNPQLAQMLPADWQSVYRAVGNGGYAGISGTLSQIMSDEKLGRLGSVALGRDGVVKRLMDIAATDKAMGQRGYDAAVQRLASIEGLMRKINQAADQKAIEDLQARIASEQAAIANEQTKVALMEQLQRAEDRLAEAQRDQIGQRALSSKNTAIPSI